MGRVEGRAVGFAEGLLDGIVVVRIIEGKPVGVTDEGRVVGMTEGLLEGLLVGVRDVGEAVGLVEGISLVGTVVGMVVGSPEGTLEGVRDIGEAVGLPVGSAEGSEVVGVAVGRLGTADGAVVGFYEVSNVSTAINKRIIVLLLQLTHTGVVAESSLTSPADKL